MKPAYLLIACALPLAAAAAWQAGGAQGYGVLLGCSAATALGLASLVWQDRLLRAGSSFALNAAVVGFLAKLLVLVAGALVLRFVAAAGERIDWRGYVLGFAGGELWTVLIGSLRHLRGRLATKERGA